MVKIYSAAKDGKKQLTPHFRVREFACSDGSDTVLVDEALVKLLERIRVWAGAEIRISSGYRTPAYNKKIGGASASYHTKGQAADIVVTGKKPAEVAKFAQAIGAGGVGLYTASRFTHVDTRTIKYLWQNAGKGNATVSTHGGACPYAVPTATLKRGSSGNGVRWLQWWLRLWGFDISVDGSFGAKTDAAVRDLQKRCGLTVDGLAGAKTRDAVRGVI